MQRLIDPQLPYVAYTIDGATFSLLLPEYEMTLKLVLFLNKIKKYINFIFK